MTTRAEGSEGLSGRLPVGQRSGVVPQTAIGLLVLMLVAIPLVPMTWQAFLDKPLYYPDAAFTWNNFTRFVTDRDIAASLGATLVFSTIVVVLSMLIGVTLALLVGRTDLPWRGVLVGLLLWPLFLSPQIIGFGAILSYGPVGFVTTAIERLIGFKPWNLYSVPGIAVITAISNVPMTLLYCLTAASQQDPNHSAAARVAGAGPQIILRRINLPLMRPAIIFAIIMNIISALEQLAIPLILGAPVGIRLLTTLIYDKSFASGVPDYGLVAALALLLLGLVVILFFIQRLLLQKAHRFVSVGSRTGRIHPLSLGKWKWPALAIVLLYILFGTAVLVGGVAIRAFTAVFSPFVSPLSVLTLNNFLLILNEPVYVRSITNTLWLAVIGAVAGTALITAVALVAQRSELRLRRVVDALAQVPRVVPGIVVGLGVFYAVVFIPPLSVLSGTIWVLLVAYLIRFLSAGYGILSPALLQISGDFDRAAKSVGAGWVRTVTRVVLPLTKPAAMSCFVLLMILIVKEYSSAIFLMKPGSEVIGSVTLSLWLQGQTGPVAALSIIQIAITTGLIFIATRILGVKLHG